MANPVKVFIALGYAKMPVSALSWRDSLQMAARSPVESARQSTDRMGLR
jgi:hypothetical protein